MHHRFTIAPRKPANMVSDSANGVAAFCTSPLTTPNVYKKQNATNGNTLNNMYSTVIQADRFSRT